MLYEKKDSAIKDEKDSSQESMVNEKTDLYQSFPITSANLQNYLEFMGSPLQSQHKKFQSFSTAACKIQRQEKYFTHLEMKTIQTDFQSMKVSLHYGFYKIEVSVICTQFQEEFFPINNLGVGSFGQIYCLEKSDYNFVVKKIKTQKKYLQTELTPIYQEYFLSVLADALGVGPKMSNPFGYNIIITKNAAFFAMEKCDTYVRQSVFIFEEDLKNNLRIMHSQKFIHLDIKNNNVAYSHSKNKYVYLDFGLSKLIQQDLNYKTLISFHGSLAYCSQEMKKCYLLQKEMFVDLYYNDVYALKKTINEHRHNHANKVQGKYQNCDYEKIYMSSFLQDSIAIFQLKFHIFEQSIQENFSQQNTEAILSIIKAYYNQMPKCLLQILSSQDISQRIIAHPQVISTILKIKALLHESKFKTKQSDLYINTYLNKQNQDDCFSQTLSIFKLLEIKRQIFLKLLSNQNRIYSLFKFLDPHSPKNWKELENYDSNCFKIKLINRIYHILNNYNQKVNVLECEKVRCVLIFLYENLTKLKSIKVLMSLRQLFICINDWVYMQKISEQIISLTTNPILKMLNIIQFELFYKISLGNFAHSKKKHMYQIFNNIPIVEQKTNLMCKIKWVGMVIFEKQASFDEQKSYQSVLVVLNQLKQNQSYRKEVCNIKFLYFQYIKVKYKFLTQIQNTLAMKIERTHYSDSNERKFEEFQKFPIQKIFPGPSFEYKMLKKNHTYDKSAKIYIQYIYLIAQNRLWCFGLNMFKFLQLQYFIQKEMIKYLSQIFVAAVERNICEDEYTIYCIFGLICEIFVFIEINDTLKYDNIQKFSPLEKSQIYEHLRKMQRMMKDNKYYEGTNKKYYQILNATIQLKFLNHNQEKEKKQSLIEIIKLARPIPMQNPLITSVIFQLFYWMKQIMLNPQNVDLQDTFLNLCNEYVTNKHFYIFEKYFAIFGLLIRIKNSRFQFQYSLNTILFFIFYIAQQNLVIPFHGFSYSLASGIGRFCKTASPLFLQLVYGQLTHKLFFCKSGEYEYLVFRIFLQIFQKFPHSNIIQQLIRITLFLPQMTHLSYLQIRPHIYKVANSMHLFKSPRKALICKRREFNLNFDQKLMNQIISQTKNKIRKLHVAHYIIDLSIFHSESIFLFSYFQNQKQNKVMSKITMKQNLKKIELEISSIQCTSKFIII